MRIALMLFVLLVGAGAVGLWVYMLVRTSREFIGSLCALDEVCRKEGEALRKDPAKSSTGVPRAFHDAFRNGFRSHDKQP